MGMIKAYALRKVYKAAAMFIQIAGRWNPCFTGADNQRRFKLFAHRGVKTIWPLLIKDKRFASGVQAGEKPDREGGTVGKIKRNRVRWSGFTLQPSRMAFHKPPKFAPCDAFTIADKRQPVRPHRRMALQ